MSSHLSTGLPITHHGLSAIDTKSAHGVQRHEVLGKRWLLSILVATATSFGEVAAAVRMIAAATSSRVYPEKEVAVIHSASSQ
jgi:hypothetical protein